MDVKRILLFIIGLFLLGLGISFTIIATETLGLGAWDAINTRLNILIPHFTIGNWLIIVSGVVTIIAAILYWQLPKFHYMLTSTLIGITVDFTSKLLHLLFPTIPHYFAFMLGLIFITIGSLIYLESHLLVSPIDYFMKSIMYRFNVNIGKAKIITEIVALIIAFAISAPISIGTFITILGLGPLFSILEKPIKIFIQKF